MTRIKQSGGVRTAAIVLIVLTILLVVGGYLGYSYYKNKNNTNIRTVTFLEGLNDGKAPKRISNGSLPVSTIGNEYTLSFWIYISDYNYRYNDDKCIFYKGRLYSNSPLNNADQSPNNKYNQGNPGIWLLNRKNTLRVQLGLETNYEGDMCGPTERFGNHNATMSSHCDVPHLPLQTWVYVNVALGSSSLDIYIDGELKKSCSLIGHPVTNVDDLHVCQNGGFNGYLSNAKYTSAVMTINDIRSEYKKGPTI